MWLISFYMEWNNESGRLLLSSHCKRQPSHLEVTEWDLYQPALDILLYICKKKEAMYDCRGWGAVWLRKQKGILAFALCILWELGANVTGESTCSTGPQDYSISLVSILMKDACMNTHNHVWKDNHTQVPTNPWTHTHKLTHLYQPQIEVQVKLTWIHWCTVCISISSTQFILCISVPYTSTHIFCTKVWEQSNSCTTQRSLNFVFLCVCTRVPAVPPHWSNKTSLMIPSTPSPTPWLWNWACRCTYRGALYESSVRPYPWCHLQLSLNPANPLRAASQTRQNNKAFCLPFHLF